MHIEDRGIIFDATTRPEQERVNAFTSLCRLQSGTILAGFQSGPAKHATTSTVRLCRSGNDGATWDDLGTPLETVLDGVPGSLSSADLLEVEPGRLLLFSTWFDRSDPARPLFDPVTEGILHSRQVCSTSDDEGATWSPWTVLPTPGLKGCASTGPALRWANGTIAHAFESFKEYDDPTPGRHGAWLAVSRDGGRTFPEFHLVAQHPQHKLYYWDQRLSAGREAESYYGLFWTHDLAQKKDLRVHFSRGCLKGTVGCVPADLAAAGSRPPRETEIPGQISAPLRLDDGRLVAFVVDRNRPGTMKLWISCDDGQTWPESDCHLAYLHDERALLKEGVDGVEFADYWDDMAKWTFGHPAVCPLGRKRLLLAWYAGVPGTLSIHWLRVTV